MMFVITTICAGLAALARAAGNGGQFAGALMSAAAFLIGCFAIFVLFFWIAWSAAMKRRTTGLGALPILFAVVRLEMTGHRVFVISNWPVIAFLVAFTITLLLLPAHRDPDLRTDNPFADGQLPPQILPPREKSL